MLHAFIRPPSPRLAHGLRTFVDRQEISIELAMTQHRAYAQALRNAGLGVVELPPHPSPDGCFVEDTAVVLDEVAALCPMGTKERRSELESVAQKLAEHRPLHRIEPPAAVEGGDVLRLGKSLYVGRTSRTNDLGIAALRQAVAPFGYSVVPVPVRGALHLKTACTFPNPETVLLNPNWVDRRTFTGLEVVEVAEAEPFAANALCLPGQALVSAAYPETARRLAAHCPIQSLDISELEKAEAGLTCLSLIFEG